MGQSRSGKVVNFASGRKFLKKNEKFLQRRNGEIEIKRLENEDFGTKFLKAK